MQPCQYCSPNFEVVFPSSVLTVASWSAYRFLRRQVRWSGLPISLGIFHSLLRSTQSKALAEVNEDFSSQWSRSRCFSAIPLLFYDPVDVGSLISGSSAFSKSSLTHLEVLGSRLQPGMENSERYFTSMRDECNCVVLWAFFHITFLWDWNENGPFPVLWPLLSFPNLLAYWVQHFHSIIFQDLK